MSMAAGCPGQVSRSAALSLDGGAEGQGLAGAGGGRSVMPSGGQGWGRGGWRELGKPGSPAQLDGSLGFQEDLAVTLEPGCKPRWAELVGLAAGGPTARLDLSPCLTLGGTRRDPRPGL